MAAKRIAQHIDFSGVMSFAAFATLATALSKSYPLWFALTMAGIGIGMALLAARNSYVQKSTALLDKYEERFFGERMEQKRKSAALFLLGEQVAEQASGDLEDVLDYLESPIADKVISGFVDAKEAYDIFYHWIRIYWQAGKDFVAEYRKEEPAAYCGLEKLYQITSAIEKRTVEDELSKSISDAELLLSSGKLKKYLYQEAGKPQ